MQLTVFGSSSPHTPPEHLAEAAALGTAIAARGDVLINGAGGAGCMGAITGACLAAGGRVKGVILRAFHDAGLTHPDIDDLHIAETMRERKRLLGHQTDAYLVLPGGPGTWEEFWEVAVERQVGTHQRPLILINHQGFYDGFLAQSRRAHAQGFLYGAVEELFAVASDAEAALALLHHDDAPEPTCS
ncbi:MAG: TIGR00730 family Rossman fold protein [Planctomycetota bacterium]